VIERYVERDLRKKLRNASSDLRLAEDLGLDSLSMMEIVILAEDVLRITIDNDELRPLRTIGDIVGFVERKLSLPR
jgi:acyl carrier protein